MSYHKIMSNRVDMIPMLYCNSGPDARKFQKSLLGLTLPSEGYQTFRLGYYSFFARLSQTFQLGYFGGIIRFRRSMDDLRNDLTVYAKRPIQEVVLTTVPADSLVANERFQLLARPGFRRSRVGHNRKRRNQAQQRLKCIPS